MKENVGTADRTVRSIAGPALMALAYTRLGANEGRLGGLATMLFGFALIETAVTRVCPLNTLLGLDTRSDELKRRDRVASLQEPLAAVKEPTRIEVR